MISNSNGSGKLKIIYNGNQFKFYFNDILMESMSISELLIDRILLYQQSATTIDFDNVFL